MDISYRQNNHFRHYTTPYFLVLFKTLFSLFLLFPSVYSPGQENSQKECQELIDLAVTTIDKGDYTKALEYLARAEILAKENRYAEELLCVKRNTGAVYNYISNYGEAMNYYNQALTIAESYPGLKSHIPRVLNNIALLYYNEENYETALEYCKRAYAMAESEDFDYGKVLLGINIAEVYNRLGDFKEAQKYLMEVEDIPTSKKLEHMWAINYAESLILERKLNEAQKIAETLINDDVDWYADVYWHVQVVKLLSKIYTLQKKYPLAISYAKDGLRETTEMKERIELYDRLSQLYLQQGEYTLAFQYKDSVIVAKDSLSGLVNRGLFETNKVRLKLQETQSEAILNKEKYQLERKLFIAGIILMLVLLFFIFIIFKSRIVKQKNEKIIAENQKKIFKLELENLKNNIAEKNRALSAKALYVSGRNELIEEVINSLGKISEVSQNREAQNYIKNLKTYLKTDAGWDDFIIYFEQINPDFLKTLKAKHPKLSSSDIRFLCYVFMNLDTREIGNIFNITYEAAKKRKQRIEEKMKLDDKGSLYEYLLKLV